MRQAITTKFLGPTDYRGSRIKATAQAGSVTVPYDHALGIDENHTEAALALARKYDWIRAGWRLEGAGLPDGTGNAYVLFRESEPLASWGETG